MAPIRNMKVAVDNLNVGNKIWHCHVVKDEK